VKQKLAFGHARLILIRFFDLASWLRGGAVGLLVLPRRRFANQREVLGGWVYEPFLKPFQDRLRGRLVSRRAAGLCRYARHESRRVRTLDPERSAAPDSGLAKQLPSPFSTKEVPQ